MTETAEMTLPEAPEALKGSKYEARCTDLVGTILVRRDATDTLSKLAASKVAASEAQRYLKAIPEDVATNDVTDALVYVDNLVEAFSSKLTETKDIAEGGDVLASLVGILGLSEDDQELLVGFTPEIRDYITALVTAYEALPDPMTVVRIADGKRPASSASSNGGAATKGMPDGSYKMLNGHGFVRQIAPGQWQAEATNGTKTVFTTKREAVAHLS